MSIVFNGMGWPRWGGFCEPHAWFPTRVGGPLGCGLCEPHVWVFQLAWVGRSGAGLGTCWRGSLVQFRLYRGPRGCGLREQSDVSNSHGSAVWRRGECLCVSDFGAGRLGSWAVSSTCMCGCTYTRGCVSALGQDIEGVCIVERHRVEARGRGL